MLRTLSSSYTSRFCEGSGSRVILNTLLRGVFVVVLLLSVFRSYGEQALRIPQIFSSNMVLQSGIQLPVWGWGLPGDTVTVEFAGQTKTAVVSEDGTWQLLLDPMAASFDPRKMIVHFATGNHKTEIGNVLVGDVWICSGQSNMEMPVGKKDDKIYRGIIDYEQELESADLPSIRLLNVPRMGSGVPAPDIPVSWVECSPETAYWFSAVAFTFGRDYQENADVPVGLINASLGGAAIHRFMPHDGFMKVESYFERELERLREAEEAHESSGSFSSTEWNEQVLSYAASTPAQTASQAWVDRDLKYPDSGHSLSGCKDPGALFNGMIHPLIPFGIKGTLWYQGESDLSKGEAYGDAIKALVTAWRARWGQGDFPFYTVEIAPFDYPNSDWPMKNAPADQRQRLVQGQRRILELENTGIVKTDDLGEMDNIHPRNKAPIGKRLAKLALGNLEK